MTGEAEALAKGDRVRHRNDWSKRGAIVAFINEVVVVRWDGIETALFEYPRNALERIADAQP